MKPTLPKDISIIYQQALAQGQALAIFRLPDAGRIHYLSGSVSRSIDDLQRAFVFAPFDPQVRPFYICPAAPSAAGPPVSPPPAPAEQRSTSKKQFTALVKKIVGEIRAGNYKKIVAARVLAVSRPASFEPSAFFDTLCHKYPAAFVSLTFIPGIGLWIGASPEVLVSETGTKLTSYSLAATKVTDDSTPWSAKEIEEQQIVTSFIHKKLSKAIPAEISIKGPLTHQAGGLKHLLSVFTIRRQGGDLWAGVVRSLHPTPAVGGMPQRKAIKFISGQEPFDRAFYSGYLGPVNRNGKTDIFVNLRCMEVTDTQLLFYAGCGITADSDSEKEWQESERKINVLKHLL